MKLSNEFKVGVLTIISVLILIFGYQYLRTGQFLQKGRTYFVYYTNVNGLSINDKVLYHGFEIGTVQDINLNSLDSQQISIMVELNITEDMPIFDNAEARIVNSDLLGEKAISIIQKQEGNPLPENAVLKGTVEHTLSQQIEEELLPVKNKIEVLVSNIDSVIGRIQGIFNVDFQGKINENLISIEGALVNIRNITQNVDEIIAMEKYHIDTIVGDVQLITTTIKNNKEELDRSIKNFADISDSLSQVEFKKIFGDLANVTARLDAIIAKLETGEGTLGELIQDDELYDNLKKVTVSLNQLVKDIQENPGRYSPSLLRIGTK